MSCKEMRRKGTTSMVVVVFAELCSVAGGRRAGSGEGDEEVAERGRPGVGDPDLLDFDDDDDEDGEDDSATAAASSAPRAD